MAWWTWLILISNLNIGDFGGLQYVFRIVTGWYWQVLQGYHHLGGLIG
jgi:hypothetical protein